MSTNQGRAALPDGHGWASRVVAEQLAACAAKPGRRACVCGIICCSEKAAGLGS
jgi:hypothetical protein